MALWRFRRFAGRSCPDFALCLRGRSTVIKTCTPFFLKIVSKLQINLSTCSCFKFSSFGLFARKKINQKINSKLKVHRDMNLVTINSWKARRKHICKCKYDLIYFDMFSLLTRALSELIIRIVLAEDRADNFTYIIFVCIYINRYINFWDICHGE